MPPVNGRETENAPHSRAIAQADSSSTKPTRNREKLFAWNEEVNSYTGEGTLSSFMIRSMSLVRSDDSKG